jgi:hypothetical protein
LDEVDDQLLFARYAVTATTEPEPTKLVSVVALNALTDAGPILSAWKQATSYR